MIVYRIERKDNHRIGVFTHPDGYYLSAGYAAIRLADKLGVVSPNDHPFPCDEGLQIIERLHCGLPHLDAYRTWFAHEAVRAVLYEDGEYHMRVYTLPTDKVQVGMLQVLFDPDDATDVRVATPEEMA